MDFERTARGRGQQGKKGMHAARAKLRVFVSWCARQEACRPSLPLARKKGKDAERSVSLHGACKTRETRAPCTRLARTGLACEVAVSCSYSSMRSCRKKRIYLVARTIRRPRTRASKTCHSLHRRGVRSSSPWNPDDEPVTRNVQKTRHKTYRCLRRHGSIRIV